MYHSRVPAILTIDPAVVNSRPALGLADYSVGIVLPKSKMSKKDNYSRPARKRTSANWKRRRADADRMRPFRLPSSQKSLAGEY